MSQSFEILGKFDRESDCQKLLYAPLNQKLTFRETNLYKVDYEGDTAAMEAFVRQVLLDPISQEMREGGSSAFEKSSFVLEYGM